MESDGISWLETIDGCGGCKNENNERFGNWFGNSGHCNADGGRRAIAANRAMISSPGSQLSR
jgi:hypothetical protein